jgi:DNA-binding response OmpR family regulator
VTERESVAPGQVSPTPNDGRREIGLAVGELVLDSIRRCVTHNGTIHPLSDKQVRLLHAFADANGVLLTSEQLLKRVYRWGEHVQTKAIKNHIQGLRALLGADCIETVHGRGYRSARLRGHSEDPAPALKPDA